MQTQQNSKFTFQYKRVHKPLVSQRNVFVFYILNCSEILVKNYSYIIKFSYQIITKYNSHNIL